MRLSLPKIGDGFGGLPKRVVEGSVKLWSAVNAYRFRAACPLLRERTGPVWEGAGSNTPQRQKQGKKKN